MKHGTLRYGKENVAYLDCMSNISRSPAFGKLLQLLLWPFAKIASHPIFICSGNSFHSFYGRMCIASPQVVPCFIFAFFNFSRNPPVASFCLAKICRRIKLHCASVSTSSALTMSSRSESSSLSAFGSGSGLSLKPAQVSAKASREGSMRRWRSLRRKLFVIAGEHDQPRGSRVEKA